MNNLVRYTYIPHLYDTLAMYRKDPDIGGYTDQHEQVVFYQKIAAYPETVKEKKQLEMWSPVTFIARRRKSDVLAIHCMVFDVDCGLPFETHHKFKRFDYIAHTSFSHSPKLHKWRLILPLQESIKPKEWKYAWSEGAAIFKSITGKNADPACKDPCRAYYVGGTTKENLHNYDSWYNEGDCRLRLEYVIPPPKKPRTVGKIKTFNQEEFTRYVNTTPNKDERQDIAHRLGAQMGDNIARKIKCPACGRFSVWFWIDVADDGMFKARCNHVNSCGYSGSITDL